MERDYELRERCLSMAISSNPLGLSTQEIIMIAERYFNYIKTVPTISQYSTQELKPLTQ